MKRKILLGTLLLSSSFTFGQMQIGNSDFEQWENVAGTDQEPVNWNSFLTASGPSSLTSFAQSQVESSTDVRPGSTGAKSARIWSRSVIGIIANGNLTVGQVNMGSASPTNSANYNISRTSDANFSEVMTDMPDSLVFWAKFTPASGSPMARVKATVHDAYDYRDPEDAASTSHVVGTAVLNYPSTNGNWVRFSVPFDYSGPASTASYILITFTTNQTPGGGAANDQVWIDDVQMIYNPTGNQQIVANDDTYGGDMDNDIVCDVLANDVDPEGQIDLASLTVVSGPTNGTTNVNNSTGEITYTPTAGYSGSDSFTYQVCDQGSPATCDFGTVNITVNFVGIEEISINAIAVKAVGNMLQFSGVENAKGEYVVYNLMGGVVKKGALTNQVSFNEKSGVYLVSVQTETGTVTKRIYKN